MSGDICNGHDLGARMWGGVRVCSYQHVAGRARNAAKHPAAHRPALTTNSFPVQNVSNAKVEKLNIEQKFLAELSSY